MTMKADFFKKIISFVLCFSFVFACMTGLAPTTHAKTLDSLKAEQNELKDKIAESEEKIKELMNQQARQEEIINELNIQIGQLNAQLDNIRDQMDVINEEITKIEREIAKLDEEIKALDVKIAEKDEEIAETVQLYCDRLRANYIAGETSVLELFTASSSLSSFLNRLELFRRVTANDQKIVDQLNREIGEIEEMKQSLEDSKAQVEADKAVLETRRADLQSVEDELESTQAEIIAKSNEVNRKLEDLNYQTQRLQISINKYNSEMDAIEDEIDNFLQQQQGGSSSSSTVSPGGWMWPVPYSNSYISSPFGYRTDPISGAYKFHAGIDITMAGAMGKNIIAVKSGTVIRTVYSNTGYGNYVMIDHGGGYVSLYAHCKSLNVSNGQHVSQGQVIAYIGSTGYSTGAHVHFEIRKNGEKVNPSNYVSK